jgi:2-haloacid dehalogenase
MPIRAVTFDCYGTLVDWEAGIRAYAAELLEQKGATDTCTPEEFVRRWEEHQFALLTPYRGYRDLAARAVERVLRDLKLPVGDEDGPGLADRIASWKPFPDTRDALKRIGAVAKVGIISNMDNVVLFETITRLGSPVHFRTSAEDARAYKPDVKPFQLALSRLGIPAADVLHAAFGWKYDLAPARTVGMRTAFVDRAGAGKPDGFEADIEVSSLAELADRVEREAQGQS